MKGVVMEESKMKQLIIYLPEDRHTDLKLYCLRKSVSMAEFIRQCIDEKIPDKYESKILRPLPRD